MKFHVIRQHYGDKQYWPGEERDADEKDVGHLVKAGVLKKTEPAPKNKAEGAAPKNKGK